MLSKNMNKKHGLALGALLGLWTGFVAAGCGDDGLARRVEGELVVTAVGTNVRYVEFGPVAPAFYDDSEDIVIDNGGDGELSITALEFIGDDTGYITPKTDLRQTPFTLTPEQSERLNFRLAIPRPADDAPPLACPAPPSDLPVEIDPARYCGQLTIRSNAARGEATQVVYILTNQGGGVLRIEPNVLNFGAPQVGRTQSQTFTIFNDGNGTLVVDSITKSEFSGNSDDNFSIEGFPFPLELQESESVEYTVEFTPETTDEVEGKLIVESNDPSNPMAVVSIRTGAANLAQIEVAPTELQFGEQTETKNVTITNTGSGAALLVTNVAISPRDSAYAVGELNGDTCTPIQGNYQKTIARQNSAVLCVTYTPGGNSNATLTISSNASNAPRVEVDLRAGPASPDAIIDPGNVIFSAAPGERFERELAIRNDGTADLTISGYELQGQLDEAELTLSPDPSGTVVGAGEIVSFTLVYERAENDLGLDVGAIIFNSNNPTELLVNVRNEAQAENFAPTAVITQSPDGAVDAGTAVTLDSADSSTQSGTITYHIWTLLNRPAGSGAEFGLDESAEPSITFTPDVPGRYRVQLVVGSDVGLEGAAVREITVSQ